MFSRADAVSQWGEEGIRRFQPDEVHDLEIPPAAKAALIELGVPRSVQPFFEADPDDTGILTLDVYARRTGARVPEGWERYYRLGGNDVSSICLTRGTGEVFCVDRWAELPDCFVNAGIEQFVASLYLIGRAYADFDGVDYDALAGRAFDIERDLASIDPKAVQDNNYWAQVIEQMKDKLL